MLKCKSSLSIVQWTNFCAFASAFVRRSEWRNKLISEAFKIPFAIIASQKLMPDSNEMGCKRGKSPKTQSKKRMCHLNTQNRVEQKTNEKVKNAKPDCFQDWRRDMMIECRLISTTLCGKINVLVSFFSWVRMDFWRKRAEKCNKLILINDLLRKGSLEKP